MVRTAEGGAHLCFGPQQQAGSAAIREVIVFLEVFYSMGVSLTPAEAGK